MDNLIKTPRTDLESMKTLMKPDSKSPYGWCSVVRSSFARTLEREIIIANNEISRLRQLIDTTHLFK